MTTKKILTLDVVSAYTGILAGNITGLYEVLNHLTGDNLFTHQLPAAMDACKEGLNAQFPWLEDNLVPLDSKNYPDRDSYLDAFGRWCMDIEKKHGTYLDVESLNNLNWVPGNALADLADMVPPEKILVVNVDDE
jgi:hypothetical protein